MNKFKAICLLGVSALTLIAALIVVFSNMGNDWDIHLFWKTFTLRRGTMMFYIAVVGGLLYWLWRKAIPAGLRAAKETRAAGRSKATAERLSKLEAGADGDEPAPTV